jgi:ATP-dependent Lon protease
VLTVNSTQGIPHPLLNRMAVYEVPAPTLEQAAGIAQRVYGGLLRELNLAGFEARLADAVLDKFLGVSPRELRKTLLDGLGHAVADGREQVLARDIRLKPAPGKGRIGF